MRRLFAAGLFAALAGVAAVLWYDHRAAAPPTAPDALATPAEDRHPDVSIRVSPVRARRKIPLPAQAAPPPAAYVSLDQLLRVPAQPAGPQSDAPVEAPSRSEAGDAETERRVRIDFSSNEPLADAPIPREWRRSEAALTVQVDEADRVRMRGGVRVDERGEGQASRDVETTPSLGLEFRF